MRHRRKGRKLNRTVSHKKALMRNLANQLFEHKEIRTTTAKAKEARSTIDRLITYAKKGDIHHRRLAFGFLRQKQSIKILFDEIAPTYADREGGYTRVLKLGQRQGDGAPMSLLQLVGFESLGESVKAEKKKKTKKKEARDEKKEVKEVIPEKKEAETAESSEEKDSDEKLKDNPVEEEKNEIGAEPESTGTADDKSEDKK
jgi:large subunit ribosomal protein L17